MPIPSFGSGSNTPVGPPAPTPVAPADPAPADPSVPFAPLGHTHVAADVTNFSEAVDDRVAAMLVQGANVTLTYNDAANTLTISATGGGGGGGNNYFPGGWP